MPRTHSAGEGNLRRSLLPPRQTSWSLLLQISNPTFPKTEALNSGCTLESPAKAFKSPTSGSYHRPITSGSPEVRAEVVIFKNSPDEYNVLPRLKP